MSLRAIVFLLIGVLCAFSSSGKDIKIRTGRALAAEVGISPVEIQGKTEYTYDDSFGWAYAVLTLKMDLGRTLSLYDYSLKIGERTFPAAALRTPEGNFAIHPNRINYPGDKKQQILFIIDDKLLTVGEDLSVVLHAEFPPKKSADTAMKFKNIADAKLKNPAAVHEKGEL